MLSLLFLILFNQKSFALDSSIRGDLLLLTDRRWLHTPNPRDKTAVDDAIAVAGADLSTSKNEFTFEARPELRALFSESLASNTQSTYLSLA